MVAAAVIHTPIIPLKRAGDIIKHRSVQGALDKSVSLKSFGDAGSLLKAQCFIHKGVEQVLAGSQIQKSDHLYSFPDCIADSTPCLICKSGRQSNAIKSEQLLTVDRQSVPRPKSGINLTGTVPEWADMSTPRYNNHLIYHKRKVQH